jgi:hypothetical protein
MAGQPQEPSWQPAAQDQTRPSWQPPSYAAQEPSFTPQEPGFTPQEPSYQPPADTMYAYAQASPPPPTGMPGQGYPPPTYSPPGGQPQGAPQWQAIAGMTPAGQGGRAPKVRVPGDKGFIGSLFDFSFQSMVTPKVIKALYVLFTAWTVLWALIFIRYGFHYGAAAGIFVLVVVVPIYLLLTLGVYRVLLEAFMVIHRMHDELKLIRSNTEQQQG